MTEARESIRPIQAGAWASALGMLFLLIYGGINHHTAGLAQPPALWLPWEAELPFLPWMVVPYWSLDIFFLISFFLVRDRDELHRHAGRILFALLASGAIFLALPLRFGFERPDTDGIPGLLFDLLGADLPYNQCPSLHISLALIYWPVVRRMATGWRQAALGLWFLLIAASTLLVYQHHLIDLAGGLVLGSLTMYLLPLRPAVLRPVTPRMQRIGLRYAGLALIALGSALLGGGIWLWLLWPFVSLSLVAGAYLAGRDDFLQKRNGVHCGVTWLLFAPYLLAQRLNWLGHKLRDGKGWVEIAPGLLLGRRLTDKEAERMVAETGARRVLDLSAELPEATPLRRIQYRHLPWLDLVPPTPAQLDEGIRWARYGEGPLYVHCSLGLLRSPAMVAALLQATGMEQSAAAMIAPARFRDGISWLGSVLAAGTTINAGIYLL